MRRAEELARLAPENPEWIEPLGPQQYLPTPGYYASTAGSIPVYRARWPPTASSPPGQARRVAAGFLQDGMRWSAMMNSKGLFAYDRRTDLDFSLTVRTDDEQGSGVCRPGLQRRGEIRFGGHRGPSPSTRPSRPAPPGPSSPANTP